MSDIPADDTAEFTLKASPWRVSVAPMMDWTDRHCRYFHRLLTRHSLLYTEMVSTGALLHGNAAQHLQFNPQEHPLALQLGGSAPTELAHCAKLAQAYGYDEVNLNCGCPSERVLRGAFGACLMGQPALVADGVKAMLDVVDIPVTVKHRIGIDRIESYGFVRDFVGTLAQAGCRVFIVHARNAWLQGLSPKENRDVPPLRYPLVYQLKRDFPDLTIVVNGGIRSHAQMSEHLAQVDGVMIGREAYHNPWLLASWDQQFYAAPDQNTGLTREAVELALVDYMERAGAHDGAPWYAIACHMLGLRHGLRGARKWRQVWSDHRLKSSPARSVWALAQAHVGPAQESD
ncbi:tRNA dihydrouridine(20/20a) synthase DusA [Hydrogenophaga sp.]|uniref:tRNA dihydrouridine(20/20a) synthase DusA n=1 Tax=Hydrogenophaga sp. TaxID=1904254 RepID=UPI0025B8AA9F|nr:tRNA dihydrouridine(20/20a) synthase DusA [Hydrogenophaga sp.]